MTPDPADGIRSDLVPHLLGQVLGSLNGIQGLEGEIGQGCRQGCRTETLPCREGRAGRDGAGERKRLGYTGLSCLSLLGYILPRRLSLRLPSAPSTHYFSILSSLSSLNSWLSPSVPPLPGTFLGSLILVPRVSQGHSLDPWLFTWQMSVSACRMPQLHRMLGRQRGARHSPDPPGTPSLEGKM